ncbi:MAG TPA: carboxypeptidase-like regulatory domain-containing protein [Bryobacteraceae bacterium]|nr:carboxypeptidase-like regulatory domain-containing protein [Bryobacteraceae bacterium]
MPTRAIFQILCLLLCLTGAVLGQEGGGHAEVGFQQYYLRTGSERVANISGLGLSFSQFIPDTGLLSGSFSPALSNSRFRSGDDYLQLKGLPWKGQHWTLHGGDFRLPGQLLAAPFTNIYVPEIAGNGAWVEASHGERSFGFYYGTATIANTPRVVLRLAVPQTLGGIYFRQKVGKRLLLGARFMHFSNDLAALRQLPNLAMQNNLKSAATLTVNSSYTVAGPLKFFGEATWSTGQQEGPKLATRNVPLSILMGPVLDTGRLTMRLNYAFQNASYFPLLGSYLGDRAGPFGEVIIRPFKRLELYGSASQYENNIARDPSLPTFRNSSESAGVSVQLPARFSVNAQVTQIALATRKDAASSWDKSNNQQQSFSLARAFSRHNIRITTRNFEQVSSLSSQRQRSQEIADNFRIGRLSVGAGVRMQRLIAIESRTSLFYHGSVQFQKGPFSLYGNFETGSDLQNKTLLATNTVSTSVLGGSLRLGKDWEINGEIFRNNLITALNPESIFVLQGQGVFVPGTLAALNQWSMYFRMTRKFNWGKGGAASDVTGYTVARAPLKGSVEGFVMERLPEGNRPAEGVPVSIDEARTVSTDADGRYRFSDVPEGPHKVALSLHELPAEFDAGKKMESAVVVASGKLVRADLDVARLAFIAGKLTGPPNVPLDSIVIRMLNTERYTTPDPDGKFYFYNMREGNYQLAVDEKTLPEFGVMQQPGPLPVSVRVGGDPETVSFGFSIQKPEKRVRKVLDKK